VPFWRRLSETVKGDVLELGCGTGRITLPLFRAGVSIVGIDRSKAMLDHASRRAAGRVALVRGDIRRLPFRSDLFGAVLAPYGMLQSLLSDADLTAALASVARVLKQGGTFGIDLVPDVPRWREYRDRVQMRGRSKNGAHLTLVESVHQDRRRHRTTFEQRYLERRGRQTREHSFTLTFRTVSVSDLMPRLEQFGFAVKALLGDYRGRPWDERADVWIILAEKV
jgi:ubiquinone/menaquinone biosynthesis C-methylase UbiE